MTIKDLKSLKTKKGRDALDLFLAEGENIVREIPKDWPVRCFVCTEAYAQKQSLSFLEKKAPCIIYKDSLFQSISDTVTPQGVLAVCEKRICLLDEVLGINPFVLLGENLSDPGNIGTLIRTACASGASGVILTEGSGDIYNPKVVRASAGGVMRIPIVENVSLEEAARAMKNAGIPLYAAYLRNAVSPYAQDFNKACCLMVGNEARGLSDEAAALADVRICLPMPGGMESLNASVAGAILMYEVVRQRSV